ncbi:MAG TPA: hypothetical protein VNA04_13375 [Thermoanaerobaculia bacterium]|nr:hypothetical protein [Thermoanaerobaculia bacterium]
MTHRTLTIPTPAEFGVRRASTSVFLQGPVINPNTTVLTRRNAGAQPALPSRGSSERKSGRPAPTF